MTRTTLAFTQHGFAVKALLSDGASSNLSLTKLLSGQSDDSSKHGSSVLSVEGSGGSRIL